MRFLQEMIAKKKHSQDAQPFADASEATTEDLSAQDLHANAFGEGRGTPEPTILPYRVPVDGESAEDGDALATFRDEANASLDSVRAELANGVDDETVEDDDDVDTSALSYDEANGARHAGEAEGREEFEYVDHFASPSKDMMDRAFAQPLQAAADVPPAPPAEEALDPALRSFFEPEDSAEPAAAPEPIAAPEPVFEAPAEAEPIAAPEPVFEAPPAPEPVAPPEPVFEAPRAPEPVAPAIDVPEPTIQAAQPEADIEEEEPAPQHPALLDTSNEPPADASLFFDKPAEDRLMERTNEILASSTQAETAQTNGAANPKKIWDIAAPAAAAVTAPTSADPAEAAQPRRRAGRVKTRLLGFNRAEDSAPDPFEEAASATNAPSKFPVGWIMVVKGPGRGSCFTLFSGASKIGRGEGQPIRLDFGDTSISRDNHAAIAYDDEQRQFYLGHGGKANLVRLNDMPVLSTEPLTDGDLIRIGETTLHFVALCGEDFAWPDTEEPEGGDAS